METRQIVARAAGVIVVVGALFGAGTATQANEQSGDHGSKAQPRAIEGVWLPIVTIRDCQTQAVIATFPSMDIYVRGGGYIGFGAVRQSDQIGMGAWRHAGGRNYTAQYQFFNYTPFGAPDGTPDGTLLRVSATIRLNAAGTAFPAPRPQTWSTPQAMCSRKSAEPEQRRGCNSRHRHRCGRWRDGTPKPSLRSALSLTTDGGQQLRVRR